MLNVMGMKNDCMSTSTVFSALLAGISIALKNSYPPRVVKGSSTRELIGMRFVRVISKTGGVCLLGVSTSLFGANRFRSTRMGAVFPKPTALAVFRHWLSTNGAWNGNSHTGRAHLVIFAVIVSASSTYLALNADTACGCRCACSTRYTGATFQGLPQRANRRNWFSTFRTWYERVAVAFVANSIIAAIDTTNLASILSHITNIPKLPKEGN